MKFIVYLHVIFFLIGMPLAAPTKQTTDLPSSSVQVKRVTETTTDLPSSSVQVKRVTTEPTCKQEMSGGANKVVVLANFFLPAVANNRWVLHGLWADDSKFQYVKSKARAYTTSVFNSMSPAVINRLAEFWMPTMNDPTQAPSLTDKKEHWFHEVNKHLNDFNSLHTSCYTKTGGETTTTKRSKRSFLKGILEGGNGKSSNKNTNNRGTAAKPATTKAAITHQATTRSHVVKTGTVPSQAKNVHTSSASASCPSSSDTTTSNQDAAAANQDTDPVYVRSLQEYLSAIVSFFPSADKPAYNVYEILKEANITPGKWYPTNDIKKAFISKFNGFNTASLVCRKHYNDRNSLLREIDLFLDITGRIDNPKRSFSFVNLPNSFKLSPDAVCQDTCVCYPTIVKSGTKKVEACTELADGCSGKFCPTTVQ